MNTDFGTLDVISAWVFLGGAIGSGIRYWLAYIVVRENEISLFPFPLDSDIFPWATLFLNIVGSFILGLVTVAPTELISVDGRIVIIAGFCGGLTTFSTFSLQTFLMLLEGALLAAIFDVLLSLALGIAAVAIGIQTGPLFWPALQELRLF